jgi:hypothetical protein
MKAHIDKARSQLSELGGLQAKTEQTERNIMKSAESRMVDVQRYIDDIKDGIDSATDEDQERYQGLIAERGTLNIIIGNAMKALGD